MPRQIAQSDSLIIASEVSEKILAYSQSLSEVVFILAGKENIIMAAHRIANIDSNPRHYFEFATKQDRIIKKLIKQQQMLFMGYAHSHPHKHHYRYPSKSDFKYLPRKLQIISFPIENEIGAWMFRQSYKKTLSSRVNLNCC